MESIEHPIFIKSINYIKSRLGSTGLEPLEQKVLERLIHSSGDFGLQHLLKFNNHACQSGVAALLSGAPIIADTAMAVEAVKPMVSRTFNMPVLNSLDWAPGTCDKSFTRSEIGMERVWLEFAQGNLGAHPPIVLIGSAPTALIALLDLVAKGATPPSLVIGMPVGFIGVLESKKKLHNSNLPQILLEGNRGGASLVAASINALLSSEYQKQ